MCEKSTSESRHVSNLGVYETGKRWVRVHGENSMTQAWGQGSDGTFLHLPALSCPLCAACAADYQPSLVRGG